MAQIDVSELLLDPDFIDPIVILRRHTIVNEFGENVLTEGRLPTVGSVQPASAKTISRLPEGLQMADVRSFFVKLEIIQDGTCQYPDIILFQGSRYQIKTAAPWLNFGGGWNEGICVREKISL